MPQVICIFRMTQKYAEHSIGEDWDLEKYKAQKEVEQLQEESHRLASLGLYNGEEGGSGGAREETKV